MEGKAQLNGLVVLYAYLQRIFMYDKVIAGLGAAPVAGDGWDWPACLDEVGVVIGRFDRLAGLSDPDVTRLLDILGEVRAAMRRRRPDPDASLPERLAAVAGDLHGGMHSNDGIVFWGETFDSTVADRYRQRTRTHRSMVNTINGYVAKATDGGVLTADDLARVDAWFTKVCTGSPGIERDLTRAGELLRGNCAR
ncbi:hypothetical protein [Nocardia arthritidis]|uniref:Uncharacterized protein n=1 Tax=Nocardia arthritidis TaxID=228602 RepID=A0A6G9YMB2_9NOCA|nr:hypothetical protein [Nocardia arthritidis]QIS14270.1 hypothetical protein F5544_32155 [Nocardia arthritidis]